MVERVIDFGTGISKVILNPTQLYPGGINHFFIDTEDAQLVIDKRAWSISKDRVVGKVCDDDGKWANICLSRVVFESMGISVQGNIIHRNRVSIDNTRSNLAEVSVQERNKSSPSRGYQIVNDRYTPMVFVKGITRSFPKVRQEDEAARLQSQLDKEFGGYDFLSDRTGEEDLIELIYAGVISEDEAEIRHLLRKANAWHVLRYGLEDIYKKHKIPIPVYELDSLGRMVDPKTKKGLCPY